MVIQFKYYRNPAETSGIEKYLPDRADASSYNRICDTSLEAQGFRAWSLVEGAG